MWIWNELCSRKEGVGLTYTFPLLDCLYSLHCVGRQCAPMLISPKIFGLIYYSSPPVWLSALVYPAGAMTCFLLLLILASLVFKALEWSKMLTCSNTSRTMWRVTSHCRGTNRQELRTGLCCYVHNIPSAQKSCAVWFCSSIHAAALTQFPLQKPGVQSHLSVCKK